MESKNVRLRDMKHILKAPRQSEKCLRETGINTGEAVYEHRGWDFPEMMKYINFKIREGWWTEEQYHWQRMYPWPLQKPESRT